MAYTNIDRPDLYFNTVLYTGNGSTQSISGVNFSPDWVWIKNRNNAYNHILTDVVRGASKSLQTNSSGAEQTDVNDLSSFDSDGFSLGSNARVNENTVPLVAWNWKAGGTASSNTDGSVTSNVSANTTSGFSICTFTGTGSSMTFGHGLGVAPNFVTVKRRDSSANGNWWTSSDPQGWTSYMTLDTTTANQSGSTRFTGNPTSTVVGVGSEIVSGGTYVAYCFASKKGYSKFGSYVGTGGGSGLIDSAPFIYTGFKPAFYIFKKSSSADDWYLIDNKRDPFNISDLALYPGLNAAESDGGGSYNGVDFLSNGIKIRNGNSSINASGETFIYMAFAENPFVTSTGIPTTAR